MRRALCAALLVGLFGCAPPTQYRGTIRVDRRGLENRVSVLCAFGLSGPDAAALCGPNEPVSLQKAAPAAESSARGSLTK